MSEMEPMKVVLPTAKPPATTILTMVGATSWSRRARRHLLRRRRAGDVRARKCH